MKVVDREEVTGDPIASVQPDFLFKPIGTARKEINNTFRSVSSFECYQLDLDSVVEQPYLPITALAPVFRQHIVGL